MIEFFPEGKQEQIRSIMAGVLKGVISQRLLPRNGGGRTAVLEVMVANARIGDLIREGKPEEIPDAIAEGDVLRHADLQAALISKGARRSVDRDVAADASSNRHDFLVALERELKTQAAAAAAPPPPDVPEPVAGLEPEPVVSGLRLAQNG